MRKHDGELKEDPLTKLLFITDSDISLLPNITIGKEWRGRVRLFEEIYQTLSMGYSKENLEYTSICLWIV